MEMSICWRYVKQINGSIRKTGGVLPCGGKRSCLKRIRVYDTDGSGSSRHSFAKHDKNNVIAENVSKLFFVFKLQVWSTGCTFQD